MAVSRFTVGTSPLVGDRAEGTVADTVEMLVLSPKEASAARRAPQRSAIDCG